MLRCYRVSNLFVEILILHLVQKPVDRCFCNEQDVFHLLSVVAFIVIMNNGSISVQTKGSKGIQVFFRDLDLFFQPAAVRIQIGERFFKRIQSHLKQFRLPVTQDRSYILLCPCCIGNRRHLFICLFQLHQLEQIWFRGILDTFAGTIILKGFVGQSRCYSCRIPVFFQGTKTKDLADTAEFFIHTHIQFCICFSDPFRLYADGQKFLESISPAKSMKVHGVIRINPSAFLVFL